MGNQGRSDRKRRIVRGYLRALVLTFGVLAGAGFDTAHGAWEFAHGDRANRGRAEVTTAPAQSRSKSVPGLGTFAPASGPVIAPDGTVYLGTLQGKLIALHADGSPFWSRDITTSPTAKQRIVASPAVGFDGSIYVIGVKRLGKPEPTLHVFTAGGGFVGSHAFPKHGTRGARSSAPPNIARIGTLEVVLVPTLYQEGSQPRELRIVGFTTAGNVVIDEFVSREGGGDVTGVPVEPCDLLGVCYRPPRVRPRGLVPMPGVAVFTGLGGGAPHVIVTEPPHRIHGFTFSDPPALTRTFRVAVHPRTVISAPMALPDNHTIVGTDRGVVFAGPNATKLPPLTSNLGAVAGAPTLLANGRAVVVDNGPKGAGIAVIEDGKHVGGRSFPGQSMVSAAASRTHIFVSTADAFHTLDATTLDEVAKIDLLGGGVSTPAIGPQGHVYTIVSDILFVFPPPRP